MDEYSDIEAIFRNTGRTTRIILASLLEISTQPWLWIKVEDHWKTGGSKVHENLRRRIKTIAENEFAMKIELRDDKQGNKFIRFVP